jgi:hypothetical protein
LEKPRSLYASRGRPRGSKDSAPRKLRRDTVSEPIPIACHGIHSESAALAPSSAAAVPIAVPIVAPALRAVLVPRHLIAQPDSVLAPTLVFGSLVYGLAHHSTTSGRASIQLAGGVTLEAPSAAVSTWLLPPNVLSDRAVGEAQSGDCSGLRSGRAGDGAVRRRAGRAGRAGYLLRRSGRPRP